MLQTIPAFHRRARREKGLKQGELVYYGPMPLYYGIGEVKRVVGEYIAVDFRGTGQFGVHEEILEHHYLIPVPAGASSFL